jgi:hypothetical protein
MYKNVLQAIDGIAIYPVFSFIIFFLFFIGLLAYALLARREFIGEMENLPLVEAENEGDLFFSVTLTPKGGLPQ